MKKTLAILLVIAMLLVMLPTMALAASTISVRTTAELNTAISSYSAGDTIFLYNGNYGLDQALLFDDLTMVGESEDGVVLTPTAGTASSGDASGWIFVDETASLNISNLTMDGTGFAIFRAIYANGTVVAENVTIKNISHHLYVGFGISLYQDAGLPAAANLTVLNVTMSNIERVGIHAKGNTTVDGFNYTGKGAIDCLDYAMEIGTISTSTAFTVSVTNATITDCLGVASDGSGSAGLYANTYFYSHPSYGDNHTPMLTVTMDGINFFNCSVGLYIGYSDAVDECSDTTISNSNFFNCDDDIAYAGAVPAVGSVTTSGNFYGGGAPTVFVTEGNVIAGLDTYVTMPVATMEDTDVTAGVDPAFMIIIPAAVDFGDLQKNSGFVAQSFPVEAVDVVIEAGYEIDVSVTSPFVMKDMDGAGVVELPYALFDEATSQVLSGTSFTAFVADRIEAGAVQVDTSLILSPGSYKGIMDFTIAYQLIPTP